MAPSIHEYTAEATPAGPQETRQARPADTGEVGNALEHLGNALTSTADVLHKREAQVEISNLSAQMAKAHADFTTGLDDTLLNADPNDRTISDKFMDSYDDKMGDIEDKISTPEAQAFFTKANATMRGHFQIAAMQGQSSLAGHQAVQDIQETTGNYSSSLLTDPSSFESVRNLNAMAIQAAVDNKTLDKVTASKLTAQADSELAKNAVRGWIGLDPNLAKKQLAGGQWDKYLKDGDVKYQLGREADAGIHGLEVEAKRQQDIRDQAQAQKTEAVKDQIISGIMDGNKVSPQDVLKNPNLTAADKEHYTKLIEAQATQKLKTDADTFTDLFSRIHAADGDPSKIMDDKPLVQAVADGKLTLAAMNQLRDEMKGGKTEQGKAEQKLYANFLDVQKGNLVKANPMLGMRDPEGMSRYQSALSDFLPAYQKARQGGKTVQQLLDPKSPDYMGKMFEVYTRTPQEVMRSLSNPSAAGSVAPAPAAQSAAPPLKTAEPRNKGESAADYLKRTGR